VDGFAVAVVWPVAGLAVAPEVGWVLPELDSSESFFLPSFLRKDFPAMDFCRLDARPKQVRKSIQPHYQVTIVSDTTSTTTTLKWYSVAKQFQGAV